MAATPPKDPCMFCGVIHLGQCGGKPAKPKKERALKVVAPQPEPQPQVETAPRPSKLDRMRAAAVDEWKPTVEAVPRRRPVVAPTAPVERQYHAALDPDTVAINGAVRALAAAELLSPKQLEEWSQVLGTQPSLEEEKLLWRMQYQAASQS